MAKYLIAAFCVILALPAYAEDDDNLSAIEQVRRLGDDYVSPDEHKAKEASKPAESKQAESEQEDAAGSDGKEAAAETPASAVPAATAPAEDGQSTMAPKSSVPPEQRQGGDITQCLEAGGKTGTDTDKDKAVAACAEPYSPRHKSDKK